jgi:hypothetical protein
MVNASSGGGSIFEIRNLSVAYGKAAAVVRARADSTE